MTLVIVNFIGFLIVSIVASSAINRVWDHVSMTTEFYLPLNASILRVNQLISDRNIVVEEIGKLQKAESFTDPGGEIGFIYTWYQTRQAILIDELNRIEESVSSLRDPNHPQFIFISEISNKLLPILGEFKNELNSKDTNISKFISEFENGNSTDFSSRKDSFLFSIQSSELDNIVDQAAMFSPDSGLKTKRVALGYTVLATLLAMSLVALVLWFVVLLNISKPLYSLTDTINAFNALGKVEETEFEQHLMGRVDELGRMSRSFNRLKHNLYAQREALQNSKEEAEKANNAKSQFLAAASHDLRQPLHAMQMYISALRGKLKDAKALAIVEDIDAVSISTGRLLNALLDVSQLEAGDIKPNAEDYPVQEILHRVARSFEPTALQKNLKLTVVKSKSYIHSDPVLLERIIGNFTSNAVRYTDEGSILIGCRHRGDNLSIEVLDTGSGIPDVEQKAIFEDFYQVHNKERDRGKGLGLGLAIARRLASRLGVIIEHDSTIDRGSRFAVLVPKGKAHPGLGKQEALTEIQNNQMKGVTILLIEDDLVVLKATHQLMAAWGCNVLTATTMDEAMAVLTRREIMAPDIIVADYRLPGGATGVEAAIHLQLMLGHAVPVIIVTGDLADGPMRDIADQGYRLLSKPVRPAKLRALISHMLR